MRRLLPVLALAGGLLLLLAVGGTDKSLGSGPGLHAPTGNRPTGIDPSGETVLPNGRIITPRGVQVRVAPHPYGLALSPDGKTLVTVNSGTAPFSVSIITDLDNSQPSVAQIPPGFPVKDSDADPQSVYIGAAFAPDNRVLYVAEGNNGRVGIFDLASHQRLGAMSVDGEFEGKSYQNSLTGDMRISADGRWLYVIDMAHFRLVTIDAQAKHVVASTSVGRLPFALTLSADGKRAYVTNVGTFHYSLVPGYDPQRAKETGLGFPPFGYPSSEAEHGTQVNGKEIPGLGDPNVVESNSVWILDVSTPKQPSIIGKLKTGLPIGPHSLSGSSPSSVVAGRNHVFVANASQDSITIIDAAYNTAVKTVTLEPSPAVRGLRGVLPIGLVLSPDEKWLYIACAGINAVAVFDTGKDEVAGYIPTAWFPARVAVSADGHTLYVANAKGFGAGPNGGPRFHAGPEGTYIGDITHGTVSIIKTPLTIPTEAHGEAGEAGKPQTDRAALSHDTNQVLRNSGFLPSSAARFARFSQIHHVVFIVKENRTFDQVFGDLMQISGERVEADPSLAEFGDDATVHAQDKEGRELTSVAVSHARVTPNHHALAQRFGTGDNFYVDGDVSVDGHHWLVGNYPNEVLESSWPAAYGGKFDFRPDPDAPGRLEMGSTHPWPEDYLQAGSLWEHLARHHISFRNYGEGLETAGDVEDKGLYPTGVREPTNMPMPQVLFENTSRTYPTFNTTISDQYRFAQFKQEFEKRYASGGNEPLPQFMFIWLPNDHTGDPRPEDGFAFSASYVADNDLALGKLVELLSHSPFWKDMAIFVTEDDAQSGRDHLDAHRSLLLVVSPYAKRGVSHVHTSMASILKTFWEILDVPPLNQYDAAATDLSDLFTDHPDFAAFTALPPDQRIFDPAKVREPGLEPGARQSEPLDDPTRIRQKMTREKLEEKKSKE